MNAYPLRSSKRRRLRDVPQESQMVDLTANSDDDDVPISIPSTPKTITSDDGCFQSLCPRLVASVASNNGSAGSQKKLLLKELRVSVKWSIVVSKRSCVRDVSQESQMVDLTANSDDDDVTIPCRPKIFTSNDGCFQSLSPHLIASVASRTGKDSGGQNNLKEVRVSVKWSTVAAPKPIHNNSDKEDASTLEIFHVNEKVFAWNGDVLHEARILKCNKEDEGDNVKYYVQYKQSHRKWLSSESVLKMTPSNRLLHSELRGLALEDYNRTENDQKQNCQENEKCNKETRFNAQPEAAVSDKQCGQVYDEEEYEELRIRYLTPRIRENVELANGITLRRQCKGRVIDQNTKGFRLLRSKIDALLKKNDHGEVYRLLCQLKQYEMNPLRTPAAFRDRNSEYDDVEEVLDLTNEDGEEGSSIDCIDVDTYILDVLLVGVKKNDKLMPLQTQSSSSPDVIPSRQEVRQVSFDDKPVEKENRNLIETPPDSDDWLEVDDVSFSDNQCVKQEPRNRGTSLSDGSATFRVDHSQIKLTISGIETFEAYAYSVVESVNKRTDFGHKGEVTDATSNDISGIPPSITPPMNMDFIADGDTGVSQEQIQIPLNASKRLPELQQSPANKDWSQKFKRCEANEISTKDDGGDDSMSRVLDGIRSGNTEVPNGNLLRWDDISKPPCQRTIDDCRTFYLRAESAEPSTRNKETTSTLYLNRTGIKADVRMNTATSTIKANKNIPTKVTGPASASASTSSAKQQPFILPRNVSTWQCYHCSTLNTPSRSRCSECGGWKFGKREDLHLLRKKWRSSAIKVSNKKRTGHSWATSKQLTATATASLGTGADFQQSTTDEARSLIQVEESSEKWASWDDIPKPPSQRTIHECQGFYLKPYVTGTPCHKSGDKSTHSRQSIPHRRFGLPSSCHDGRRNGLNSASGLSAFVQQLNCKPPRPREHSQISDTFARPGVFSKHGVHIPEKDHPKEMAQHNHSIISPTLNRQLEFSWAGQQPNPASLPQKAEASSVDCTLVADAFPPSPMRFKSSVAQVVTPEAASISDIPQPADSRNWTCRCGRMVLFRKSRCGTCHRWRGGQRPNRRKKRKLNLDEMSAKLHANPQMKCNRFSVTDFGLSCKPRMKSSPFCVYPRRIKRDLRQLESAKWDGIGINSDLKMFNNALNTPSFSLIPRTRVIATRNKPHIFNKLCWHEDPIMSQPKRMTKLAQQSPHHCQLFPSNVPSIMMDSSERRTSYASRTCNFGNIIIPGRLPLSVTEKKSPVAKNVSSESHPIAAIPGKTPDNQKQPPREKKKKRKLNSKKASTKKNFAPNTKSCLFSVTDFGFCCKPNIKSSRLLITPKRGERESCRLDPAKCNDYSWRRGSKRFKNTIDIPQFPLIPRRRITAKRNARLCLLKDWNKQIKRRRLGEWVPSGHLTGRWKPPSWADIKHFSSNLKPKKNPSCKKSLLPELDGLLSNFMAQMKMNRSTCTDTSPSQSLQDFVCPQYAKPTVKLLRAAHSAMTNLLPKGDCEDWEVVKLARQHYDYWRPKETKVILIAESHAHTTKDRAFNGPGLDKDILHDTYFGPREYLSLVYSPAYGENGALQGKVKDKANKGTPQFWTLFAALSRGVKHVAVTRTSNKTFSSPFAADLLKGGGLPVEDRLDAKLEVLKDNCNRGIWLLDASIFGWYMAQVQEYSRSSNTNEVHRRAKSRPPKELKTPSLVLSWELFTKHVIREVAEEGNLKLVVPIGMEVEAALTRERIEDAVRGKSNVRVTETFPAPNAWIPGGYGPFHAKLAALVDEAAPRIDAGVKTECIGNENTKTDDSERRKGGNDIV